jgi:hypothetical protein
MAGAARGKQIFQERVQFIFPFPSPGASGYTAEVAGTAAVAATGLITCTTKANYADTDYMTIGDGLTPAKLYEFDFAGDGVTSGRVAVDISGATTAAEVAAILRTAILANQPAFTVTDNLDGTLTLTHKWPGTGGNVTMTDNVVNVAHTVAGMSAGAAPVAHTAASFTTSITTDTTIKLMTVDEDFDVDQVEVISPVGLATDAANYYVISLKKGSTIMASWSTLTGAEGALTANTLMSMTLSATVGNRRASKGDVLSLSLDETGTQTLPAGHVVIRGRMR